MKKMPSLVTSDIYRIDVVYAATAQILEMPEAVELKGWAVKALGACDAEPAEVSMRIVNRKEITQLNAQYRQKATATNVLAFPLNAPLADDLCLLGDIVICAAVVSDEAKKQAKSIQAHFAHMVIHGILHLLGYDHVEASAAEDMEQLEINILCGLGFPNPYNNS